MASPRVPTRQGLRLRDPRPISADRDVTKRIETKLNPDDMLQGNPVQKLT